MELVHLLHQYKITSNVNRIEEAQVICLGETHTSDFHRKINACVIETFGKLTDLVLVESPYKEAVQESSQTKYVQVPINIKGWDIKERPVDIDEERLSQLASKVCRACSAIFGITLVSPFLETRYLSLGLPLASFIAGGIYIAASLVSLFAEHAIKNLPPRNQNMCRCIETNLKYYKRIFVIAGSLHFEKNSEAAGNPQFDNSYCIEETMRYLKSKKFFILIPKSESLLPPPMPDGGS